VILEEIKIDEDNPDVLVHELFTQSFWKDHPLGWPILGTSKTVARLDRQQLFAYHGDRFHGGNMVFSAAGNLDHDQFAEAVAGKFSALAGGATLHELPAPEASARIVLRNKKSLEQVQICLGVPAPPITDENRYATLILNTVLGGGMSSRLFQTIREERGMAYSIYSDLSPYRDTGTCASTPAPRRARPGGGGPDSGGVPQAEAEPLSEEELTRAKDQLKGNILLGLESSNARMANLARQEMYFHSSSPSTRSSPASTRWTRPRCRPWPSGSSIPRIAVTLLGRLDGVKLRRAKLVC
jgi:predicted Zn-dependent peptidase